MQWASFAEGGLADRPHPINLVSIGSETERLARSIISARPRIWRAGSLSIFGHPNPYPQKPTTPNGRGRMVEAHLKPAERMSALKSTSTSRDRTSAMGVVGEGQGGDRCVSSTKNKTCHEQHSGKSYFVILLFLLIFQLRGAGYNCDSGSS